MLCEYLAKTCILNGLHMPQYHLSGWNIIFVIYTTVKCLGSVRIFYVFERGLFCSQRLHLFDQNEVKTVIL